LSRVAGRAPNAQHDVALGRDHLEWLWPPVEPEPGAQGLMAVHPEPQLFHHGVYSGAVGHWPGAADRQPGAQAIHRLPQSELAPGELTDARTVASEPDHDLLSHAPTV